MTIKRRLFISNILMLVIPVILTLLTAAFVFFIYIHVNGIKDFSSFNKRDEFNNHVADISELSQKWTLDTEKSEIKKDVDAFNNKHNDTVTLYIYESLEPAFPDLAIPDASLEDIVLLQSEETVLIRETTASYVVRSHGLTLVLVDTEYTLSDIKGDVQGDYRSIVIFAFLIIVVLSTSRLLTRSVFRSIIKPIDMLVGGVRQIRDGNLSHRIEYRGKDEFAGVCSDFNEMAQRLSDSVKERQKDEANRKELIAGISHDLRTPLTSIKAYLEGIEKGVATTPQAQTKYFDTIKAKSAELEQIINQLFLFSKIDIGEFPFRLEKLDIAEELNEFVEDIFEEYEHNGLTVAFAQASEKIYAIIDKTQFRNVLFNIAGNSLKYKTKEQGRLDISAKAEDGKVIIKLQDDGDGVPPDSIDKLFDVFYRCDPSRSNQNSGSGLGLAIAAKVIERLGGTISAQNADSGGLTILITLPVLAEGETA